LAGMARAAARRRAISARAAAKAAAISAVAARLRRPSMVARPSSPSAATRRAWAFARLAVGSPTGRVGHQPGRVVAGGGVGVEAVEGVVGPQVAKRFSWRQRLNMA